MDIKVKAVEGTLNLQYTENGGNAGIDLVATSKSENELYIEYGTNLALEIPEGYAGFLMPRSSISNYHLVLANSVGLIDSNYRGEIKLRFKKTLYRPHINMYNIGDRVGQLLIIPVPRVKLVEVDSLGETDRGTGGFGSSGV
jgi:dUTP pyrophosphatase